MSPGFKLVPDFILPGLESGTYGPHLQWEDRSKGFFRISRVHQNSERWSEECFRVYKEWSIQKRLWNSDDPKRVSKAKHCLVTALRRNPEIEMLQREPTCYRFRVLLDTGTQNYFVAEKQSLRKKTGLKVKHTSGSVKKYLGPKLGKTYRRISKSNSTHATDGSERGNCNSVIPQAVLFKDPFIGNDYLMPIRICGNDEESCQKVEEKTISSDKCCCDILLDFSLCNKNCLWHGVQSYL